MASMVKGTGAVQLKSPFYRAFLLLSRLLVRFRANQPCENTAPAHQKFQPCNTKRLHVLGRCNVPHVRETYHRRNGSRRSDLRTNQHPLGLEALGLPVGVRSVQIAILRPRVISIGFQLTPSQKRSAHFVTRQMTTIRGCGWSVIVRNVSATLGVDWRTSIRPQNRGVARDLIAAEYGYVN